MSSDVLVEGLSQIVECEDLSEDQMSLIMQQIMTGHSSPELIAAFLTAMRMKGTTVQEMTAAVKVMRQLVSGVTLSNACAVDIVGTGGDGASLFNVSTASAFICAAAGISVAKHGNYGFSSSSGSADVLKAAGVNLLLNAQQVKQCIETLNIGFMFAPQHHPAMKHVGNIRKLLGFRTVMNLMGPLTNPAGVKRQLVGVYRKDLCAVLAHVLVNTGSEHVMVVHSEEGLDEISPAAPTFVVEYQMGEFKEYTLNPKDFGIEYSNLDGLSVSGPEASLALIRSALGGGELSLSAKKAADMLMLNAGAAIYLAGTVPSMELGIEKAKEVIRSGQALKHLNLLADFSQGFSKS